MIPSQRHLFDIPDDVAYLNCAYISPMMRKVVKAGISGVNRKAQPWTMTAPTFFDEAEHARGLFAKLIGATAEDIAIVPAVSYGIATAALNLPLRRGQKIVVVEDQFPSNVYAWREKARETGAEIVTVSAHGTHDLNSPVLDAIREDAGIVALPHCRWTDGALIDLVRVGERCREVGAALVLDVIQSLGALPFDVRKVQPDFLVCASYKWLLGPYSLGFLYVAPHRHDGNPLEEGWIARAQSENFARLVDYQDAYQPGARRYDMGERSNFHLMPMAITAIEQILDWTVTEIAETLAARTREIAAHANDRGLRSTPETLRAGHYLGVELPAGTPDDLPQRLAARNVYASVRGRMLRITPHLWNTDDDVARLFQALDAELSPA